MEGYGNENPGAFQPTRPLRGATQMPDIKRLFIRNFNPRAPCGARPNSLGESATHTDFNPRAPCGARPTTSALPWTHCYFNPRAPCGARRPDPTQRKRRRWNFNPRAPCGARQTVPVTPYTADATFQPTRPLRGATTMSEDQCVLTLFQPTRPLRGATQRASPYDICQTISTHAPLAGRDSIAS